MGSPKKQKQGKRRKSRRISQRALRRSYRKLERIVRKEQRLKNQAFEDNLSDVKSILPCAIKTSQRKLTKIYGYHADPSLPLWKNVEVVFENMPTLEYFSRPSRMAFHDLCTSKVAPQGIGTTLGLGLKFCVQTDRPPDNLSKSFSRFADDVRRKFMFAGTPMKEVSKKIYVKSEWVPPPADSHVEDRISKFCSSILAEHKFLRNIQKKSSNLTHLQKSHINFYVQTEILSS